MPKPRSDALIACRVEDGFRIAELLMRGVRPVELGRQPRADEFAPWWAEMTVLAAVAYRRAVEIVTGRVTA